MMTERHSEVVVVHDTPSNRATQRLYRIRNRHTDCVASVEHQHPVFDGRLVPQRLLVDTVGRRIAAFAADQPDERNDLLPVLRGVRERTVRRKLPSSLLERLLANLDVELRVVGFPLHNPEQRNRAVVPYSTDTTRQHHNVVRHNCRLTSLRIHHVRKTLPHQHVPELATRLGTRSVETTPTVTVVGIQPELGCRLRRVRRERHLKVDRLRYTITTVTSHQHRLTTGHKIVKRSLDTRPVGVRHRNV